MCWVFHYLQTLLIFEGIPLCTYYNRRQCFESSDTWLSGRTSTKAQSHWTKINMILAIFLYWNIELDKWKLLRQILLSGCFRRYFYVVNVNRLWQPCKLGNWTCVDIMLLKFPTVSKNWADRRVQEISCRDSKDVNRLENEKIFASLETNVKTFCPVVFPLTYQGNVNLESNCSEATSSRESISNSMSLLGTRNIFTFTVLISLYMSQCKYKMYTRTSSTTV